MNAHHFLSPALLSLSPSFSTSRLSARSSPPLMATVLRTPSSRALSAPHLPNISLHSPKPTSISFRQRPTNTCCSRPLRLSDTKPLRFVRLVPFASEEESETQIESETQEQEEPQQPEIVDGTDDAVIAEDGAIEDEVGNVEEMPMSPILASLQSYKEAVASEDTSRVLEVEAFLKSLEDEKINLELKVATLTKELSVERERVLRIGADFDNFRKRTDRERLSLVSNARGELVESLLSVLDNFERAKTQIKAGTEAEEKINNSYQSIYKQFMEILSSLGVVPVEPKGNPFDPLGRYRVGSKFSRVLDEFNRVVNQVGSGFKKTWARFYSKSLD